MPFDDSTTNEFRKVVAKARQLLVEEFTSQCQGIYGIQPDGSTIDLARLGHLPQEEQLRAQLLRTRIHHLAAGISTSEVKAEATTRMVREQAFTVLNRLCALRMCEERDLVQECVRSGYDSKGFRLYDQSAARVMGDTYTRYRLFLQLLFDELSVDLGVLFDRFALTGLLFPRENALKEALGLVNCSKLHHIWVEDEAIGWVYQYFNSKEERDAMRKASRSPRNSRELAVRNQFFTPRYVVEFLTDNTLGRTWYETRKGQTTLRDECRYLVRRQNECFLASGEVAPATASDPDEISQKEVLKKSVYIDHRPKKDPRDLRILDPACGSGHFLLYAFDLLERIYREAWEDPESPQSETTGHTMREDFETADKLSRSIPKLIIEHNLHGVDIDPRAAQIAALALWLRAQKTWKNLGLKTTERPRISKSNIVVAEPMPGEEDMRHGFTAELKPRVLGQLVDVVFEKMKLAGEAGLLLRIEEEIKDAVSEARRQWLRAPQPEQQLLFPGLRTPRPQQQEFHFDISGVTDESFWRQAEERILSVLKEYAETADVDDSVSRRLFADDAARGFAFIDLCRKRYDVILMNPPFGASTRDSKEYIDDRYPNTRGDVLANFIERMLALAGPQGCVGAISSRTPFFLGSFDDFRTEVLGKSGHVGLFADLGEGVLDAMVETATYVLTRNPPNEAGAIFFRLLVDPDKSDMLLELVGNFSRAHASEKIFLIDPGSFDPGHPYAYWVSKATLTKLSARSPIEGNKCSIRVGLQTSKDFRFLRLLWEVPANTIVLGVPPGETETDAKHYLNALSRGKRWVPFSKTEMAVPWYSPITLVVNWEAGGQEIKALAIEKGDSPSRNVRSETEYFRPGFSYMLRSTRLVPYLVPTGIIPTAGRAQIFPKEGQEYTVLGICASNVGSAIARFSGEKFGWPKFQASMVQGLPSCDFSDETLAAIKQHVDAEVDNRRAVMRRYEPFHEFTMPAWIQSSNEGETAWDLYSLFGKPLEIKIAAAFDLSSDQLSELERDIREAVSIRRSPEIDDSEDLDQNSEDDEPELSIEPITETPEEKAVGLLMYCIGVAFGRWDIRIALNPSLAPKLPDAFEVLPICPPGMLVDPDGLPASSNRIVSEEWLHARPGANRVPLATTVKEPIIRDVDYPLRISWDGVLVDDPDLNESLPHRDDITRRVREVLHVLFKDRAHAVEQEACSILGATDLRTYLRKATGFFKDHLKRYSKSGRKAPIYLPLSTESGNYTIWLYYPRLSDQMLYGCVNDYVDPKLKDIEKDLDRLRDSSSADRKTRERVDELVELQQDLKTLREKLLKVAGLPYKPDQSDGVLISVAPLWQLFRHRPWQTAVKKCWEELDKKKYEWAHLAYAIWPDRVQEACKSDKSIAIAHRLEMIL
jgi:23S rRNA G2445 N2-methylase RlmL